MTLKRRSLRGAQRRRDLEGSVPGKIRLVLTTSRGVLPPYSRRMPRVAQSSPPSSAYRRRFVDGHMDILRPAFSVPRERATRYAVGGAPIEIPIAVKIDDGLIDRW